MPDQPPIRMYRTRGCPFCVMAATLLDRMGLAYEEVFLDDRPDRRQVTAEILPGHRTVPLILIAGEPIGGFEDLCRMRDDGGLDRLSDRGED